MTTRKASIVASVDLYLALPMSRPDGSSFLGDSSRSVKRSVGGREAWPTRDGGVWFDDREGTDRQWDIATPLRKRENPEKDACVGG